MDTPKTQSQAYKFLYEESIDEWQALMGMDLHQATAWDDFDYLWIYRELIRMDKTTKCYIVRRFNDEKNLSIWRDGDFTRHWNHKGFREDDKRRKAKKALEKRINDYQSSNGKANFSIIDD